MKANNIAIFIAAAFIWGTSWISIKLQIGEVHPSWSIFYRSSIAAILIFTYCSFTKKNMSFNFREHVAMASQGVLLFCLNLTFLYEGSFHLMSGLVGLINASIILLNIFNAKVFLKISTSFRAIVGSIIGILGLTIIISSTIHDYSWFADSFNIGMGVVLCLTGTYLASLGQTMSFNNQLKKKLPILQTNSYGLIYASILSLALALTSGHPATFAFNSQYILSLLYSSIIGTIFAFGIYLTLLGRIGTTKASYIYIISPIFAILLSYYFEGFNFNTELLLGFVLIIMGNILVITKKSSKVRNFLSNIKLYSNSSV